MPNKIDFPNIKPSSRSYTPGTYPQTEFVAQNGAKTILRYGNKPVNAKLTLGFTNITDSQANEILNKYEEVNSVYDYIEFTSANALAGVNTSSLVNNMAEEDSNGVKLRYRFDGPPTVTSVIDGISNVQCKFVACLDGD
tara:strand:- start:1271 stop:1687 length:417 start_codon:yes stop_codon:yes gene_type:complete